MHIWGDHLDRSERKKGGSAILVLMRGEETYSPSEASRVLGRSGRKISERRIRQMLQAGELEGARDEGGRWRIPRRVVNQLLAERRERNQFREGPESMPGAPESVRELMDRVAALERERGRLEGRLELTEQTESTLREQLERERERSEAERERAEKLQEELDQARRPWWKRVFGGNG